MKPITEDKMKAILWDGGDFPNSLSYVDRDIPEPSPGWVLVNVKAVGICGSDLHVLHGENKYLVPSKNIPAVFGHENAGVVAKVGKGVTAVKPGDRVAIEPLHPCTCYGETCAMCRQGQYHLCIPGLAFVGMPIGRFVIPGGYGEYALAHETRVFRIPDGLSFREAAILDTLAVEVHALKVGNPQIGEVAAVMGCGIVGLEMIQCLRARGIRDIIAIAKYAFQAELARRMGARDTVVMNPGADPVKEVMKLTAGMGVNQVYECVGGQTDAVANSLAICGKGGKVMMIGGASRPRPIDLQAMILQESSLLSCMSYSHSGALRDFEISLNLLREGLVDHKSLITHTFAPEEYRKAFQIALAKDREAVVKVMLVRE
jgi:threonine dehydrogenase-like Zn-dependent dehydrogenase